MQREMPRHIAIILDGNGRWAQKRALPRQVGHGAGAENFRKIALHAKARGLKYLTVYAFSTENWSRPSSEVSALMKIFKKYFREGIEGLIEKERMKIHILGDQSAFDEEIRQLAAKCYEIAERVETDIHANVCLNYGSRAEITRAAQKLARRAANGEIKPEEITEQMISDSLYTAGMPDPDLIIRTGGEYRLSNFLLWQAAYSELYITDTLWPDFDENAFDVALEYYFNRERRFGNVGKKIKRGE